MSFLAWAHHIPYETNLLQELDKPKDPVELPSCMAVRRGSWVGMVVVVPAFASGQYRHRPVVSTFVIGVVRTIAPAMCRGVHQPGDVPHQDRAHEHAPDQQTR